jgi:hypothetical protein
MRQGQPGLSENPTARGTSRTKSVDANIFVAFAGGSTDLEDEEDISEYEPARPKDRATKAPGAPKPKRVQEPPLNPTEGNNIGQGKGAATKDRARNEESKGVTIILRAVQTVAEELRTSITQQETKYTTILDVVAALRSEIIGIKIELSETRTELSEARTELSGARTELLEVKEEATASKAKLAIELATMYRELAAIRSGPLSAGSTLGIGGVWVNAKP